MPAFAEKDPAMAAALDALQPGCFDATAKSVALRAYQVLGGLQAAQMAVYADNSERSTRVPRSYADIRVDRKGHRVRIGGTPGKDETFAWIAEEYPDFAGWQDPMARYVASRNGTIELGSVISQLYMASRAFFVHPDCPAEPLTLCREPKRGAVLIRHHLENRGQNKKELKSSTRQRVQAADQPILRVARQDGRLPAGRVARPAALEPRGSRRAAQEGKQVADGTRPDAGLARGEVPRGADGRRLRLAPHPASGTTSTASSTAAASACGAPCWRR
jgi:hypothetical protein